MTEQTTERRGITTWLQESVTVKLFFILDAYNNPA